ncbi:hypothetical protein ACFQV8_36360 [Pseudonocardia benzenivorans]
MTLTLDLSFWDTVLLVVVVILVSLVAGRILGVRRGFWRAAAAGVLGTLVGLAVAATLVGNDPTSTASDVLLVAFGFAVLATMIISVALEAVLRPRRTARRGSLRTRVRTFLTVGGRLWEVVRIARRNGLAGPRLASRAALSSPEGACGSGASSRTAGACSSSSGRSPRPARICCRRRSSTRWPICRPTSRRCRPR